ncbi:MAG: DoxX family protein [Pikeienuella sp.]
MITLHNAVFGFFQRILENWLLGLAARAVFAGTLFVYFYNSFLTKVDAANGDYFTVRDSAFIQIYGDKVFEAVQYDFSSLAFWPWGFIVYLGTYAEIVLPVLIILGFMTRIASLGMLIFIGVMTYKDITGEVLPPSLMVPGYEAPAAAPATPAPAAEAGATADATASPAETAPVTAPVAASVETNPESPYGGVSAETIGTWFDGKPDSEIVDQRAYWAFVLFYLFLRGAGAISLDRLLGGRPDDDEDDDEY